MCPGEGVAANIATQTVRSCRGASVTLIPVYSDTVSSCPLLSTPCCPMQKLATATVDISARVVRIGLEAVDQGILLAALSYIIMRMR